MDADSPRMISHKASQNLNEISTIHCKSLAKQAHSLVLKFPHHHHYFYVQPASAIFIFPASSPACFTGAGLDIQGVGQITLPSASKSQQESKESPPGTMQINTSVLWLRGKLQVWDLRGGGELGVGRKVQKNPPRTVPVQ